MLYIIAMNKKLYLDVPVFWNFVSFIKIALWHLSAYMSLKYKNKKSTAKKYEQRYLS